MPLVTRTTTAGNIIKQATEPTDKTNGTVWVDTSEDPPVTNIANGTSYSVLAILVGSVPLSLDKAIGA